MNTNDTSGSFGTRTAPCPIEVSASLNQLIKCSTYDTFVLAQASRVPSRGISGTITQFLTPCEYKVVDGELQHPRNVTIHLGVVRGLRQIVYSTFMLAIILSVVRSD